MFGGRTTRADQIPTKAHLVSSRACSDPAFALLRTSLQRSSTSCLPCRCSTSGLRQTSGGSASSARSPSLAGVSTSRPASPRHGVMRCALPHHTCRDPTPAAVAFSALPASSTPAVPMAFRAGTPLPPRQHVSTSARSAFTIWPCLTITPRLALSCRHALSGPVSSPHSTSLSMPSTVCHRQPTLVLLCFFPARSRSSTS